MVQLNRHLLHFGMKFDGPLFPNFSSARVVSVRISSEIVVSRLNMSSNSSRLGKHAPLLSGVLLDHGTDDPLRDRRPPLVPLGRLTGSRTIAPLRQTNQRAANAHNILEHDDFFKTRVVDWHQLVVRTFSVPEDGYI